MVLKKITSAVGYGLSAVGCRLSAMDCRLSAVSYRLFAKKNLRLATYLLIAYHSSLITTSCTSAPDKLGDLDLVQWRSDRGACNEKRTQQVEAFKAVQSQLLSKHINEVGEILGRPDIHQLGRRDQKFYVYFLEKGVHCNDIKAPSNAKKVILRFNSIGLLAEIIYQTEAL